MKVFGDTHNSFEVQRHLVEPGAGRAVVVDARFNGVHSSLLVMDNRREADEPVLSMAGRRGPARNPDATQFYTLSGTPIMPAGHCIVPPGFPSPLCGRR